LDCNDREISVLFTGDREIALLNEKYLGRKGPTDVISFPMEGEGDGGLESSLLGDVVISVDTAAREAEQSGETLERSVMRLLAHGLLHLLGYDHEGSEGLASEMEKQEARLIELMCGL